MAVTRIEEGGLGTDSFNLPVTLNGSDGSSTDAGDNIVLDASASGVDAGERLLYEGIPPDFANISDDTSVLAGATLTVNDNGAISVASGGSVTIDSGATITNNGTATGFGGSDPSSADGDSLGTASLEWSDLYLADGGIIYLGDDQDVTLTHVADTGILLNSSRKIQFGDSATFIHQSSDGVMTVDGEATIDLNASTAVLVSNDLKLDSDSAVLGFGADNDITLTHAADTSLTVGGAGGTTGMIINNTATDGDPFLAFSLSGTQTFTMGVDDGDSDKFKIGTTAIGTSTAFSMDSSGNVAITGDLTVTGDDITMTTNTSGAALIADGTNFNPVVISGDATIATNGALTIAANAVEGSILNTNVISGQTALTSAVATTDELLISDAGTIKRVDVSLITDLATGDATALAIALG